MTKERKDYLESVAEDFGVDFYTVFILADMLGENEDYDGLLSILEDEAERLEALCGGYDG